MQARDITSRINASLLLEKTVGALMTHVAPGSLICWEYGKSIGAENPDNVDPRCSDGTLSKEFLRFVRTRAQQLIKEKIGRLAAAIDENDGAINLYRGLLVDAAWLNSDITSRPAGVCWSWDYEFARSYDPDMNEQLSACDPEIEEEPIEVRLVSVIEIDDVDWTETIRLNASELYTVGEEREVRLKATAKVEIAGVDWRPFSFYSTEKFQTVERFEAQGLIVTAGPVRVNPGVKSGATAWFLQPSGA